MVTFGVAPGFLLVKDGAELCVFAPWRRVDHGGGFPACAAMRLARFNVETGDEDDHMSFSGLPSPAAAGSIAGFAILFYTTRIESQIAGKEWLADVDRAVQHVLPWFSPWPCRH